MSTNLHDYGEMAALAAQAATARARAHPIMAEVVPGMRPAWYVATTYANFERTAAAHLIARGFGTYLPEISRSAVVNRRLRTIAHPLLPGYVLVFVWGIERHLPRIKACPGIEGVLARTVPVSPEDELHVPVAVPDSFIDQIQVAEFNDMIREGRITAASAEKPKRSRRGRKNRVESYITEANRLEDEAHTVTISTKSYWSSITELDDEGRKSLFHRALGLAS